MNELPDNPISATVDFAREGVQHGFLKLPYSRDDSAWGAVMIPLTVIQRGMDGGSRRSGRSGLLQIKIES